MTSISGMLFNFDDTDYVAPSWSGDVYNFGVEEEEFSTLYQVYTDANYVYAATSVGLGIYDIASEEKCAYINNSNGFSTVWGNDSVVFVGTTISGLKYLNKTCISGSIVEPYDLFTCLIDYTEYSLTSDGINYIHGNNDLLLCCTTSGVDVVKTGLQSYRSYTTISGGARRCFMTSSGKFYYTTTSGNVGFLNRVNSCLWNWNTPDYYYSTNGDILKMV